MKHLSVALFVLFYCALVNAQIGGCSTGISSFLFTPIAGTSDIELKVTSNCCQVHNLNSFDYTNNAPNHAITLCYIDTGLLMPTTITTTNILNNANAPGEQTFIINSFINYLNTSTTCSSGMPFGSITISLTTPIIEPRTFLSTEDNLFIKKTSLSPNPNSGVFTIELPTDTDPVRLTISDLSGKKVYIIDNYLSGKIINLNELSNGIYFAKIDYNQSSETLKFIIN